MLGGALAVCLAVTALPYLNPPDALQETVSRTATLQSFDVEEKRLSTDGPPVHVDRDLVLQKADGNEVLGPAALKALDQYGGARVRLVGSVDWDGSMTARRLEIVAR